MIKKSLRLKGESQQPAKKANIKQFLKDWEEARKNVRKSYPESRFQIFHLSAKAKATDERRNRERQQALLQVDQKYLSKLDELDPNHTVNLGSKAPSGKTKGYISNRSCIFGGTGLLGGALGILIIGLTVQTDNNNEPHPLRNRYFASSIGEIPNIASPYKKHNMMLSPLDINQVPTEVKYFLHSFYDPNSVPYSFKPLAVTDHELLNVLPRNTIQSNDKADHVMIIKGGRILRSFNEGKKESIFKDPGDTIRFIVPLGFSITKNPLVANEDGQKVELAKQVDGQEFVLLRELHDDDDIFIYLKQTKLQYPVVEATKPNDQNEFEQEIVSRIEAAGNNANLIKQALGDYISRRRLTDPESFRENAVIYTSASLNSNLGKKVYSLLDEDLKREIGLNQCSGNVDDICKRILAGVLPYSGAHCILNNDGDDLINADDAHTILIFQTPDGKQHFFEATLPSLLHPKPIHRAEVTPEHAAKLQSLLNQIKKAEKGSEIRVKLVDQFRDFLIKSVAYYKSGRFIFDEVREQSRLIQ